MRKTNQDIKVLMRKLLDTVKQNISLHLHAMSTMLAAYYKPGQDTADLRRVPIPKPASGEVLLKVKACGVCHSDVSPRSP